MASLSWPARVDACETEEEVLGAARDYLATLDSREFAQLPPDCRPRKLVDAADLAAYAFDLVRHHVSEDSEAGALVNRLAAFFAHANIRLSRILARTNDEDGAVRESA